MSTDLSTGIILPMEPLVVSWLAFAIALVSLCVTLWRTRNTDIDELATEVHKLVRKSRAETMRRVRAEKGEPAPDGESAFSVPPQLRAGIQAPPPGTFVDKNAERLRLLK